ncbi:MAG: sulfatase-like hydrolase/transferase, partial [Acidobacteria bacterium]|nr:sulfatase-like hydrolase/transferase [Acidobacteriota bacterium]
MSVTRREFLSGSLLLPATPSALGGAPANRPNVILMMADDLGWGDPGFNGNRVIHTPNLDAMAKAGIRFTRFYSGGPVCSPTRGTCLTGRHYFRYGITHANEGALPKPEFTIAEMLKPLGYATGHFGKWHLGTLTEAIKDGRRGGPGTKSYSPPWEHGFDECFSTEQAVPTWDPMKDQPFVTKYWTGPGQYARENLEGDDSRVMMDRVVPFVRRAAKAGRPFLAVVWFHAPHAPVAAGPEHRAMYSQYGEDQQHYYGCITALDEQVGRLRRELRELGVADNTMTWFASDNGPEGMTGDQGRNRGSTGGLRGRKRSLFSGGVNVPALLEWPGHARPGRVVDLECSTLDYFPTVRDVVGFGMPGKPRPTDGVSLASLIDGKMTSRPAPISFRYIEDPLPMHGSPTVAMVEGRYKLLTNFAAGGPEDMLFDLVADRAETRNIIGKQPEMVRSMKTRLRDWIASC